MSLSALFYAVSATIIRHVAAELPVFEVVFLRNVFSIAFMLPWLLRVGPASLRTRRLGGHGLRGLGSAVNMSCQVGALALIPVADMAAINFLQPIFGAIIAIVFLHEAASGRRWSATLVGFAGALIIIRPGFEEANVGILFAVGAAMMGSIIAIMIKDLVRTEPPDTIAAYLFITQTVIMLVPALLVWQPPSWPDLLWLAALGLVGVWLQRSFNRGMAAADATVALPFNFTRLLWAALLGWLAFGELPDAWTWIGGAVIFAASVMLTRRGT